MNVLVCNAGSSSLKFALLEAEGEQLLAGGGVDWAPTPSGTARRVLEELRSGRSGSAPAIDAVGHRVVHGGARYPRAVRITSEVEGAIGDLAELAPLHNAPSLEVVRAMTEALPGVPQVAAFDTSFHATIPEPARTYPVPRQWTREWGLRRFGFHGLSHSYCAARAAEMIGRRPARELRVIIAHLGNGASVSAVRNGTCVDTSMGFTPLEGLMMGTRSGSVDPGMLIYLMREKGLDAGRLDEALNHESGLLGVSGLSADMRRVLAAEAHDADARLAVAIYVHRARQAIGAMAATLGGLDALVFTAGVGEHSAEIRRRICENLGHLGLALDPGANDSCAPDEDVSTPGSAARILVIATREDLSILREVRRLVRPGAPEAREPPAARDRAQRRPQHREHSP
jgi:acetate kinase